MELTEEMRYAFDLIENTSQCLFITGKAGSGKTTFLKYIVDNTKKCCAVAAPTGIAAINCGGVTLHSLFGIPLGLQLPNMPMKGFMHKEKIQMFKKLDVLIIDEISMVRPDILDYVDRKLRLYRFNNEPFGGVQIVMFGDLFQLPPVIPKEEWKMLEEFYEGGYFYYSLVWKECDFKMIELNHVFRQHDSQFVRILNNIREYKTTWTDIQDLDVVRDRRAAQDFTNPHIHLCVFKKDADKINMSMLREATHKYTASYTGKFNPKAAPCDDELNLRVGARVMMLVNDPNKMYYNGSMGIVEDLEESAVGVRLDNGNYVSVGPYEWNEQEYVMKPNGEVTTTVKGSCVQIPLTLGWAITIHKSQGLTFDKIVVHANRTFASGQLYVALSRCTSMDGILTDSFINFSHVIPDLKLNAFFKAVRENNNLFNKKVQKNLYKNEAVSIDD